MTNKSTLVSFDQLLADLTTRTNALVAQKQIAFMKTADLREVLEVSVGHVYLGIRQGKTMAQVVANIGHKVRDMLELKRDSSLAAKVGTFVLESYGFLKLVDLEEKLMPNSKHTAYYVVAKDDASLSALWEDVRPEKCEALPKFSPPADWMSGIHDTGLPIVKHGSLKLLSQFTLEKHYTLFNTLNRYQRQAWFINREVLGVYSRLSNMKADNQVAHRVVDEITGEIDTTFPFDWMMEEERDVRKSKRMEANSIKRMAKKVGDNLFYHQYNCDFRGRIYPTTAFLHEQGSDNAKGLLLLSNGAELGEYGYDWLLYHTTNCFGEDKLSREARVEFTRDRLVEFIGFAKDPYANTGWMAADNRWSFLAACIELRKIMEWVMAGNAIEAYVCHLPIFIDGSNNGVQHLTALSKDHTVAHLVNLVPSEKPGDVYAYIADIVWSKYVETALTGLSAEEKALFEVVSANLSELKAKYREVQAWKLEKTDLEARAAKRARLGELAAEMKAVRDSNKDLLEDSRCYYWSKVTSSKQRRSVCKRPTMTLGYGGTAWGMGDQILQDLKKTSDAYFKDMDMSQARWMGGLIHHVCMKHLPGPAKMLNLFQDLAGISNAANQKLRWTVPGTNFPVVQQYRKARSERVGMDYCGKFIRLNIQIVEEKTLDTSKQTSAAAPNVIHSFDAAHLVMTVDACKFACVTIHDSFGCLPGNMAEMSRIVREQFVAFYALDPLTNLLKQHDAMHLMPTLGELDLTSVLDADFAFH